MSTITFVVAVAAAISLGTAGAWILTMKLLTSKRGKQAVKDYARDLTDLTYELMKENIELEKETKRWTELITSATFDNE